jgi:hypothetical protein
MLSTDLARRLREAGLPWHPASGDRFFLPDRGMDDEVFVISEMTVGVHRFPHETVIGFNGVTEWALDSVEQREAVWLPSEAQLRELLGDRFVCLERRPDGTHVVTVTGRLDDDETADRESTHARSAADAYALALLRSWDD